VAVYFFPHRVNRFGDIRSPIVLRTMSRPDAGGIVVRKFGSCFLLFFWCFLLFPPSLPRGLFRAVSATPLSPWRTPQMFVFCVHLLVDIVLIFRCAGTFFWQILPPFPSVSRGWRMPGSFRPPRCLGFFLPRRWRVFANDPVFCAGVSYFPTPTFATRCCDRPVPPSSGPPPILFSCGPRSQPHRSRCGGARRLVSSLRRGLQTPLELPFLC